MDFKLMLLNGALNAIARAHPEYAGVIRTVIEHEDKADEIVAVIKAAVAEGAPAFEAARAAAPKLEAAVRQLAATMPGYAPTPAAAEQKIHTSTENILRGMAGIGHMDPEAEQRWMDNTTANLRDSQAGGG